MNKKIESIIDSKKIIKEYDNKIIWDKIIKNWNYLFYSRKMGKIIKNSMPISIFWENYFYFVINYEKKVFNNFYSDLKHGKKDFDSEDFIFLEVIYNILLLNKNKLKKLKIINKTINNIEKFINNQGYIFSKYNIENNIFFKISNQKVEEINKVVKNNILKNSINEYLTLEENQKNICKKRTIILNLYIEIEKKKKRIEEEFDKAIAKKIFSEVNNLGIKHNNDVEKKDFNGATTYSFKDKIGKIYLENITEKEYIRKLDKLFRILSFINNFLD